MRERGREFEEMDVYVYDCMQGMAREPMLGTCMYLSVEVGGWQWARDPQNISSLKVPVHLGQSNEERGPASMNGLWRADRGSPIF